MSFLYSKESLMCRGIAIGVSLGLLTVGWASYNLQFREFYHVITSNNNRATTLTVCDLYQMEKAMSSVSSMHQCRRGEHCPVERSDPINKNSYAGISVLNVVTENPWLGSTIRGSYQDAIRRHSTGQPYINGLGVYPDIYSNTILAPHMLVQANALALNPREPKNQKMQNFIHTITPFVNQSIGQACQTQAFVNALSHTPLKDIPEPYKYLVFSLRKFYHNPETPTRFQEKDPKTGRWLSTFDIANLNKDSMNLAIRAHSILLALSVTQKVSQNRVSSRTTTQGMMDPIARHFLRKHVDISQDAPFYVAKYLLQLLVKEVNSILSAKNVESEPNVAHVIKDLETPKKVQEMFLKWKSKANNAVQGKNHTVTPITGSTVSKSLPDFASDLHRAINYISEEWFQNELTEAQREVFNEVISDKKATKPMLVQMLLQALEETIGKSASGSREWVDQFSEPVVFVKKSLLWWILPEYSLDQFK